MKKINTFLKDKKIVMKYFCSAIRVLFLFSCKSKTEKEICLESLTYVKNENQLAPPLVILFFKDNSGVIEKAINNESFEAFFFYSFKKEDRMQGYTKQNYYEKDGELTKLSIGINYFNDLSRKDWTKNQIEEFLIKDGIGLIIGKDTISVKSCQFEQ